MKTYVKPTFFRGALGSGAWIPRHRGRPETLQLKTEKVFWNFWRFLKPLKISETQTDQKRQVGRRPILKLWKTFWKRLQGKSSTWAAGGVSWWLKKDNYETSCSNFIISIHVSRRDEFEEMNRLGNFISLIIDGSISSWEHESMMNSKWIRDEFILRKWKGSKMKSMHDDPRDSADFKVFE